MRVFRVVLLLALLVWVTGVLVADENFQEQVKVQEVGGYEYTWVLDSDYPKVGGIRTWDKSTAWAVGAGADNYWDLQGVMDEDPINHQSITNYSMDIWSDWHIQILGGTVRQDGSAYVQKLGSTAYWDLFFDTDPGYDSGMRAIAPSNLETVGNGGKLIVHFVWDPIVPDQTVTIRQWPTTDFIPEPSSILVLASGITGLAFSLRRRIK